MKKYFESLREHTMKIISSKQKKMKLLKTNSSNHMEMQKFVILVKKGIKIAKSKIIVIIQVNTDMLHKVYVI